MLRVIHENLNEHRGQRRWLAIVPIVRNAFTAICNFFDETLSSTCPIEARVFVARKGAAEQAVEKLRKAKGRDRKVLLDRAIFTFERADEKLSFLPPLHRRRLEFMLLHARFLVEYMKDKKRAELLVQEALTEIRNNGAYYDECDANEQKKIRALLKQFGQIL